jgi:transcription elongation GreA/GreB family factor
MDKRFLTDQLIDQLRASARTAMHAQEDATSAAKIGAIHLRRMAQTQGERAARANAEADALATFRPGALRAGAPIQLGALVEIEDEESGEGRTFFLAPAGAGVSLTGPGGDGFLSVVTPASPIGRAVIGKKTGDVVDVTVEGDVREWTITWVG